MKTYKYPIEFVKPNQVFVFGSNTEGRHGKGAALWALKFAGAKYGLAAGLIGQSYAIITKDLRSKEKRPKEAIIKAITQLYVEYAQESPNFEFLITYRDAPNLNGYTPKEMAEMFLEAGPIPENIVFEESFVKLLNQ